MRPARTWEILNANLEAWATDLARREPSDVIRLIGGCLRYFEDASFFREGAAFASSSLLFSAEFFSFPVFGFFGVSGSPALFLMIGAPAAVIFFAAANSSFRFALSSRTTLGMFRFVPLVMRAP